MSTPPTTVSAVVTLPASVLQHMCFLQRQLVSCLDTLLVQSTFPPSPLPPVPPFSPLLSSSFQPFSTSRTMPHHLAELGDEGLVSSGVDMSEDEVHPPSDSTTSSPKQDTTASSDSSSSAARRVPKKRHHLHKLSNRKGKRHLDSLTSTKSVRKLLSFIEDLPASADLDIPPFIIPNGEVPDEPSPEEAGYDEFTARWYQRYRDAVAKRNPMAYTVRGVMSDCFYTHMVKELLHPGHLDGCGLSASNPRMHAALKARVGRNSRQILFRAVVSTTDEDGAEIRPSVPVLYVVAPSSFSTPSPPHTDCLRVVPISQLRLLLHDTHTSLLHRVTAVFPHLNKLYSNVTREMCEDFNKYCQQCNAKKAHTTRHRELHPIISRTPRERYVIDFIDMQGDPDTVKHDGVYRWILHMIDHGSKYRWAKGLKTKHATGVMRVVREWWYEWGRPDILHSDNGGEFSADLVADLCLEWGVQKRHGRPYRPQTQGAIERANRQLKAYLAAWRANPANQGRGWVAALPEITRAANHAYTRAICTTPIEAFPRVESSRTMPGKGKLDLEDREDTDLESGGSESDGDEEDTRKGLLEVLENVEGAEGIVQSIIATDLTVSVMTHSPVILSQSLAVNSSESVSCRPAEVPSASVAPETNVSHPVQGPAELVQDPRRTRSHTAKANLKAEAPSPQAEPSLPEPEEKGEVAHLDGYSSDVEDGNEDGAWQEMGSEVLMWTELQTKLKADDPAHPLDRLHIVPRGHVEALWFPMWSKVCPQFPKLLRLVGVNAEGNCGPTAACSARLELYFHKRVATQQEWRESRSSALQWLRQNQQLYDKLNKGRVSDSHELISQCNRDAAHVFVDFFRVYAWLHQLNVFVFTVDVVTFPDEENKPGTAKINSTFSCRLFNTLDDGVTSIQSPQLNTIAIHFHHVHPEGRRGVGHFEFLIDSRGHSLWTAKDPVVIECLEVASKQTRNFRRLHHYAQRMQVQEAHTAHAKLFVVGQVANLQVRKTVREAVPAGVHLHQNMYVRLLEEANSGRPMRTFSALSHAGVLSESVPTHELAVCGQDVDENLLTRPVSASDLAVNNRVSLLTAWKFEVSRALAPNPAAVASCSETADVDASHVGPATRSRSAAKTAAGRLPQSSETQSSVHVCGSCRKEFSLPIGLPVIRCIGRCQQTLHTLAEQCTRSRHWSQTAGGRICSTVCKGVLQ